MTIHRRNAILLCQRFKPTIPLNGSVVSTSDNRNRQRRDKARGIIKLVHVGEMNRRVE